MMPVQFKAWTVALACSAVVLMVAPQAIAQTSPKGTMQQQITKRQALMSEGSQKIMDASKKLREAMKIMQEQKGYPRARQMMTHADKTMLQGERLLNGASKIDAMLLQDTRTSLEAERKMMKGARLMQNGMLTMMNDEKALSRAHRIVTEGHDLLKQGQNAVMAQLK